MTHSPEPVCRRQEHGGARLRPPARDLLRVGSRRWFLQTGLTGIAGLSLPALLRCRAEGRTAPAADRKAVILIWLSGGPSHIDTWDPKPGAPAEIRGPFHSISTKVPGVRISEHLPLQASIMDRLAIVRSVDCRSSTDHFPAPMQAGNPLAQRSTIDPHIGTHPSMGAVAAKFRGPNDPALPAFVGMGDLNLFFADVLGASPMGGAYEPADAAQLAGRLTLPKGVTVDQVQDRAGLCRQFDRLRRDLDTGDTMARMDHYSRQALDIILSGKAERAFRTDLEPPRVHDAYGRHSLGQRTLLARRLVEAGVTFVTVSGAFGVFDNHGDDVIWKGMINGLKPLLPPLDQAVSALVKDLEARGLLDDTLVLVLGEFGRSPIFSQRGTGGREHWPNCMSMLLAGGHIAHGQVVGSTDAKGGDVKDARVTPADLGATVYRHLGIDLSAQWIHPQGRPQNIVTEGGRPIPELS
ncbi:MAG TPA: DUF1501 domain-containing protein [Gemmataceae bacterium]|jgi:uncharacterized protein (DUF1501 family)|nr:DUF1501 domain-containing protein [Gemmataceae bacterium]